MSRHFFCLMTLNSLQMNIHVWLRWTSLRPLTAVILIYLGLPDRILGLLRNQWQEHFRWVTFAGSVHPTPIQGAKGLPQGDPWSPIAMSLVLMLAKRRADSLIPTSRSLLYLDDRTILAPNAQTFQRALDAWNALCDTTRLRNNNAKQQFLARCPTQYHNKSEAQLNPSHTIEVWESRWGQDQGKGPPKKSSVPNMCHKFRLACRFCLVLRSLKQC